jgi:hypothetical protein
MARGQVHVQDWQLRRRTMGKTSIVPVCLKPSDGRRGRYPKSDTSLPRAMIVAPSCSDLYSLANDREMILRSADRGAQRSRSTAADGHISG